MAAQTLGSAIGRRNRTLGVRLLLIAAVLLSGIAYAPLARAESLPAPSLGAPAPAATVTANPEFTWSPVALAVKYRIQVATTSAFSSISYTADVFGTTATPTADLPTGPLHWRVASIDSGGTLGPYSASQSFTKDQAPPPVLIGPADGAVLNYPGDRPVLSWQPVPGMKQYRVEIDDESTFSGATAYVTASTSLALPTVLPSSTPRYWRLQGLSTTAGVTTGWSSLTDLRSFSIQWDSSAVPTLQAPADSLDQAIDDFTFRWSAVPGATSYELQLDTDENFNPPLTTSAVTHATQYRPTSTLNSDQYFWRVRAIQQGGQVADWSSVRSLKRDWLDGAGLQARPSVLLTDTDLGTAGIQAEIESDKVSVSWTPIRRAAKYQLQISTSPSFAGTPTTCTTPHTTWTPYVSGNYTETGGFGPCDWMGSPGITYYVRVRAIEERTAGVDLTSLWSNFARSDGVVPQPVSFSLVSSTSVPSAAWEPAEILSSPNAPDTPKLTWRPVSGATSYRVGLSRDSSFTNQVLVGGYATTRQTELIFNEVLLDNNVGEPFFWYVLPCNSGGCVGAEQAVNVPGRYKWFEKLGLAVETNAGPDVQTDTVSLSWADQLSTSPAGGGIRWYQFEVRNAANAVVDSGFTDATGYTPIAETYPDGVYNWRVRAIDAAGVGLVWSSARSFEKRSSVPSPLPSASPVTLPVLRWEPTAFASGYQVEVYRGVDAAFPALNRVVSAFTVDYPVATLSTALPADTYSWRVRQLDATGKPGPWSTDVRPFTVALGAASLTAPGDGSAPDAPRIVYRWSPVTGAVRYRLESSLTPGFGSLHQNVVTTGTAYAPTAAHSGGVQYFWRVSALNASDNPMSTSPVSTFTSLGLPAAPSASASASGTTVTFSWTAPANGGSPITGYILRYRVAGATWTELFRDADVRSVALTGLATSTRYEGQVTAINGVGTGPFSSLVSASTATVPGAPGGLKVTPGVGSLAVSWSAPSNGGSAITGYVVRFAPSAGGAQSQLNVTSTSTTLTGLANSTAYSVDVAAQNAVGTGPFATSVQGVTLAPPTTPSSSSVVTTLSIAGGRTIVYGGSAQLSGALTTASGAALAGKSLTVQSRPVGSTTWSKVSVVTTSTAGSYTATVKPTVNREYRVVFAGASPNQASTSSAATVLVRPKITRKVSANKVRLGTKVVFSGSIAPSHKARTVYLQRLQSGKWVSKKSVKTSSTSTYKIAVVTKSRKDFRWRIHLPAHADHTAGLSAKIKLIVK